MIEKNRSAFEATNVLKWQQDNLGEGTTIVVLDEGLEPHKHMAHQVEVMTFGEVKANTPKTGHGSGVMSIIHEVAPKARIVYFPFNNVSKEQKFEMLQWIIDNSEKIDVITMSMTWYAPTAREYFDTIKWLKIPFTVASGNDGDISKGGVSSPADFDYTLAIGATSGKFSSQERYSNGGKELMCVAPLILAPNATMTEFPRAGTSFTTPYVAGALSLYTSWRRRNNLPKFTHTDAVELIKTNALDITSERFPEEYKVGHDYPTGWGLFRLPSEIPSIIVPEPPKEEPKPEPEKPVPIPEPLPETPKEEPVKVGDNLRLIIDAGHGGEDTGGYSGGYREKDLNLVVAKRVKELLKEYSPSMTREDDKLIIWNDRANLIKDKYDVCISLHLNIGGGTGVEAIHSYVSTRGKAIATSIVDSINKIAGIPKRPNAVFSKRNAQGDDYYYMHRLTGNTTTVIVESCFLDNDVDKMMLNVEKIAQSISSGFKSWVGKNTTSTPTPSKTVSTRTFRSFESDVHVLDVPKGYKLSVDLGIRFKLETVLSIVKNKLAQGKKILGATNCGFFVDGNNEHVTLYIADGKYYNPPSINSVDFIYYKDGHTEVTNLHGYDQVILSKLQADAHWAIGTSYCLMKDGKINLMLTEKYAHSKNKEPRTMIGQKVDGSFVLVVVDGRSSTSKGMTASEQAQTMLGLGCINAVNLDGGGSSTMVTVKDGVAKVYNKLPNSVQRAVGSVFLVEEV